MHIVIIAQQQKIPSPNKQAYGKAVISRIRFYLTIQQLFSHYMLMHFFSLPLKGWSGLMVKGLVLCCTSRMVAILLYNHGVCDHSFSFAIID